MQADKLFTIELDILDINIVDYTVSKLCIENSKHKLHNFYLNSSYNADPYKRKRSYNADNIV